MNNIDTLLDELYYAGFSKGKQEQGGLPFPITKEQAVELSKQALNLYIEEQVKAAKIEELKSFIEYRVVSHGIGEKARSVSVKKIEERIAELRNK